MVYLRVETGPSFLNRITTRCCSLSQARADRADNAEAAEGEAKAIREARKKKAADLHMHADDDGNVMASFSKKELAKQKVGIKWGRTEETNQYVIAQIVPDSPAAKQHLEEGMILLQVGDKDVSDGKISDTGLSHYLKTRPLKFKFEIQLSAHDQRDAQVEENGAASAIQAAHRKKIKVREPNKGEDGLIVVTFPKKCKDTGFVWTRAEGGVVTVTSVTPKSHAAKQAIAEGMVLRFVGETDAAEITDDAALTKELKTRPLLCKFE